MKRRKFLSYLRRYVFRVPEGCVAPKLLMFIYYILFPLNWFYEKQSMIKYDCVRDIYKINGTEFSAEIFDFIADASNEGKIFQLNKPGKNAMITDLTSKINDNKKHLIEQN